MNSRTTEFIAGLFVLIGLAAIIYLAVRIGGGQFFGNDTYLIKARFQNVSGLTPGSRVNVAGVPVGTVSVITLDPETYAAIVEMRIRSRTKLDEDTIASVKSQGLIGDKYVALLPGGSDILLEDGDLIIDTESSVDIEDLISQFAFGSLQEKEAAAEKGDELGGDSFAEPEPPEAR